MAAADDVDPGGVGGQGDVEDARVGLGLGEGGVVAAGAADQGAAGAAASRGQQVVAGAAVEVGGARQAADQPVFAFSAVDVVAARAGLDQVVLRAAVDGVVAGAAGDADVLDRRQGALDPEAVVAGAEFGHQPAGGAADGAGDLAEVGGVGVFAAFADGDRPGVVDPEGPGAFVEGDRDVVGAAAADELEAAASARGGVELRVGAAGGLFGAAGDADRPALASVAPLAPVELVLAAAADDVVVAGTADDRVVPPVADQGVVEGRAFEALEAVELVVAVAVRPVGRQRGPDAGVALPPTSVAKEAMSPLPEPPYIWS